MKQPSQCDRVLAVLRDGHWHRMEEIHQRAGFMRLNSRISDLRERGHKIECDKRGHQYRYRLLPTGSLAEPLSQEAPPSSTDRGAERVGGASTLFDLPARKPAWS